MVPIHNVNLLILVHNKRAVKRLYSTGFGMDLFSIVVYNLQTFLARNIDHLCTNVKEQLQLNYLFQII